jgi:hypothetical protein
MNRSLRIAVGRPALLSGRLRGRRLGDPVDLPAPAGARAVRGRLAAVSVRASLAAGAWVGAVIGLVLGAVLGGLVVWFAGAVLDWQRDLAFTFGVTRRLLPFGDQLGLLRDIQTRWWLVIIGTSLGVAFVAALFGSLLGGILAAAYNRSPRHALVVVELPSHVAAPHPAAEPELVHSGGRFHAAEAEADRSSSSP